MSVHKVLLLSLPILMCPLAGADIISGVVKEAGGGPALAGVRVQFQEDTRIFVETDAQGKFTFNTDQITGMRSVMPRYEQPRLSWNAGEGTLAWEGLTGRVALQIRDVRGHLVYSESVGGMRISVSNLPEGVYVATVTAPGKAPLRAVMHMSSAGKISRGAFSAAPVSKPGDASQVGRALAKVAATTKLGWYKMGYASKWETVSGSKTDMVIEMAQDPTGIGFHEYLYAGEWQRQSKSDQVMYIVRGGKVVWSYSTGGEYGDASLLSDGHIVYSMQSWARVMKMETKQQVWEIKTGSGEEIHTTQPIGLDRVFIVRNGSPGQAEIWNWRTNKLEYVFKYNVEGLVSTGNSHGQARHHRILKNGNILAAQMSLKMVVEYDTAQKKPVWKCPSGGGTWAAVRTFEGTTIVSGDGGGTVKEFDKDCNIVWDIKKDEFQASHGFSFASVQEVMRLKNGNTVINIWKGAKGSSPQIVEVTKDKKIVWILKQWANPNLDWASSTHILDEPGLMENFELVR